jgi:hypothetical protein
MGFHGDSWILRDFMRFHGDLPGFTLISFAKLVSITPMKCSTIF